MPQDTQEAASYRPISQLKSADDLVKRFELLQRKRQLAEREWKLNLAFYKGKQYSYFSNSSRRIENLPVDEGDKPRYLVRIVSNQIMTGAHSLLAKYTKTRPVISATPGSGSDHDIKAAQMAERLLEYWWGEFAMDDLLEEALLWGIIAGNGFWKISWDPHAGKSMRFMLDPSGQPILDDQLKDAYRAELEQFGIEAEEQQVYMGDIRIEALSPFDVFLDPNAKTFGECKYAICVHHLDPDEIKARWGKDFKPDSVSADPDTTLPVGDATGGSEPTIKRVFTGYFKPTPALPRGRYVVWVEKPNTILEDGPWPYPSTDLPLIKFPGIRVPGSVLDEAIVTQARPIQKELNRTISQIVMYKNLTVKPRVWAPVGSLRTRLTAEPGAAYEFVPIAGMRPEVEKLPTLPPYVFEHLADIGARLRDIFALTEVTEGQVPPNVEAGVAIDLLQEMATDRLAPTIKLIESSLAKAGQIMLTFAQQYYVEPRLLKIKGSGGSIQVKRFTQADIDGGVTLQAEAGSGLPRTRAGRQARITQFIELGILPPDKAWKYLDLADMKSLAQGFQLDEDHAYREHDALVRGEPLNPYALQKAMEAIQQGIDPETGEELLGDEDLQSILQRAALAPGVADMHQVHFDVHRMWINTVEFRGLPEYVQAAALEHFQLTQQAMQQLPQPEPQAPRVTMQIKGTAGPTVASDILRSAGVDATPEEFMEQPLETWVTDKIDEPDADSAGNDPLTDLEMQQHQADVESEKAREQTAKADLAEKKLAQSDFKPKPRKAA